MTRLSVSIAVLTVLAAAGCASRPRISPLAAAARVGDIAAIRSLLAAGADPDALDPGADRWTPLLHAIHKGQRHAVDALLDGGANANRTTPAGGIPLLMATGSGRTDIVARLLSAGAEPAGYGSELLVTALSGGALIDLDQPLLGRCNTDMVRLIVRRFPEIRLRSGVRTRAAVLAAHLNDCDEALRLVRRTQLPARAASDRPGHD